MGWWNKWDWWWSASPSLSLTCTHTPFKQEIGCFLFTRKWLLWTWHIWKSIHLITSHYCADPPLVLPTLVDLIYSTQESVQISASTTLVALLVNHKRKPEVLCLLLDCLRYFDKWSFSFFIYLFGNLRFKEFLQSRICICNFNNFNTVLFSDSQNPDSGALVGRKEGMAWSLLPTCRPNFCGGPSLLLH